MESFSLRLITDYLFDCILARPRDKFSWGTFFLSLTFFSKAELSRSWFDGSSILLIMEGTWVEFGKPLIINTRSYASSDFRMTIIPKLGFWIIDTWSRQHRTFCTSQILYFGTHRIWKLNFRDIFWSISSRTRHQWPVLFYFFVYYSNRLLTTFNCSRWNIISSWP